MLFAIDTATNTRFLVTASLVSLLLTGCTYLPASGPSMQAIEKAATAKLSTEKSKSGFEYALVDLSKSVLRYFDTYRPQSFQSLADGAGPHSDTSLGVGDVVTVTIYESQAGGLFIPQNGSVPGNFVTLPQQTIDKDGMISVPYVGAVKVTGRPVSEAQSDIQSQLANKAIEPQVIITTVASRSDRVSVLGDVNAPAELELSPSGERLLDVISRVGGLNAPEIETSVTIERGGRQVTALFASIVSDPAENIYVRAGDTIYLHRERRTFLAFGASGLNGRFDFRESNLTLGEALAQAGGLLDSRANPSQVFLYRPVSRKTLDKLGIDTTPFESDSIPVIFRADLRDPTMFFAVQKFRMQDKDLIYVSNADSIELSKFLDVINGVSNTATDVVVNAASSKAAVEYLAN